MISKPYLIQQISVYVGGGFHDFCTAAIDLAAAGMTMLVVTHEMGFAREVADEVLFLYDGIIFEKGTPDEVINHPQKERTQAFLNAVL